MELLSSDGPIADIADGGYRVQMNCNADGGQVVYHIHLHLMGGRAFGT